MKRSDLLPEILFDESLDSTEIQTYQNKYLRPILKFQHAHLRLLVIHWCTQTNPLFLDLSVQAKRKMVSQILQNNQALRNQIIGIISGYLELEQFQWYLRNKSECNKRILAMALKRVIDTF